MRIFAALLLVASSLLLTNTAKAQEGDVNSRLQRTERDLATLQRLVYQGQNPPAGALSPAVPPSLGGGDVERRLNDIESTLQGLTGQIEALNNRIAQIERGGTAAAINGTVPAAPEVGAPQPIAAGTVPGVAMALPPTPGTAPAPLTGTAISGTVPGGALTPPVPPLSGGIKESSAAAYTKGFSLMQQGEYVAAEAAFKNFLKDYPGDTLAGNAQYWLAETYYARKDYNNAASNFLTSYQKYPKNSKAADSLLKLGLSLSGLGSSEQACKTFKRMGTEYPDAAPALRSRAKEEMGKLACK